MADPRLVALVDVKAQQYGVPVALARAVVAQESGFNPNAKSPVGAGGLMQLMPGTAAGLGVKDIFNPEQNVDGGMRYLANLLHQFKDPKLALAAYNAGPAAVKKYGGVPHYAETQNYVQAILAHAGSMGSAPVPPTQTLPADAGQSGAAGIIPQGQSVSDLLQASLPTDAGVNILQKLGGTAAGVAQRAQEPIPMPQDAQAPSASPPGGNGQQQPDPYNPQDLIPHSSGLAGDIPMAVGGKNPYTNIHFAGHVDFQHVNPRLWDAINREAKKLGGVATVISGYRSNEYSAKNGGFAGDPHTKGLAGDVYINGHPIGEVVPPEVWAKYGIRSGNTPGFYKGKPDPEHLDLVGVPVKRGQKK